MRLLVSGTRRAKTLHRPLIAARLRAIAGEYPPPYTILHGAAPGVDRLADALAVEWGWQVERFPADWDQHGRAAGPLRNQQMVEEGRPDFVAAFPAVDDGMRGGTGNLVDYATRAGLPCIVYPLHVRGEHR